MQKGDLVISQLSAIRNRTGKSYASQKLKLLQALKFHKLKNATEIHLLNSTLLFLLAYPDNKSIYIHSIRFLKKLELLIQSDKRISASLYNSGITKTKLCASFSFEMVKWMQKNYPHDIRLSDIEADDSKISSILSVVMAKVESEILQDGNADWKFWLLQSQKDEEQLLEKIINVFDQSNIRPEVIDELWSALGINVEIAFSRHTCLPESIIDIYFHRSIVNKREFSNTVFIKPQQKKLSKEDAEQVVAASRIALIRQLREIDPISFTSAALVSYYQLDRGLGIALMGMVNERRHPVDSYFGYVAFKNGLPVAYAGSWILFDSARIGLNVFPEYRGGESAWIFQQVMNLHSKIFNLNRFTVDPYQLGKDNSDGIKSGAFWIYYKAGFRPLKIIQKQIAEEEEKKVRKNPLHRTSPGVLKKLADSRMELVMNKKAVGFDATDCSRAFAEIIRMQFDGNRKEARLYCLNKMLAWIPQKINVEEKMRFVLENWAVLLFNRNKGLPKNVKVKNKLKKLFMLKVYASEKEYLAALQTFDELKEYMSRLTRKIK